MVEVRSLDEAERQRFAAARFAAVDAHPYLATALFAVEPVAAPGLATFAVDRHWRLYLDPEVLCDTWSVREAAGVLVHEVMHLLRDHATRLDALRPDPDERERREWNVACDCAINDDLVTGPLPLPDPLLPAAIGAPAGRLEEEYFQRRRDREDERRDVDAEWAADCGSGVDGRPRSWEIGNPTDAHPGVSAGEAVRIRRLVANEIRAAEGRAPGRVPAGLTRWAQPEVEPTVDWRHELRVAVRRAIRQRLGWLTTTWTRPSRRSLPSDPFLRPATTSPAPAITVVVDTSASMWPQDLGVALAELDALQRAHRRGRIRYLSCDTAATASADVRRIDDIAFVGGGGTDLRVGIEVAQSSRPIPDAIVVITDGETPWPAGSPAVTTIALVVGIGPTAPAPIRTIRVRTARPG